MTFSGERTKPPNGKWRNKRTGKIREGWWSYYWPSDRFDIHIKGCRPQSVKGCEEPEYGLWEIIDD